MIFDYDLLISTLVAYLIGSIPCGYLVARFNNVNDIREHGSGNIGATNVARILGLKYFFIVFFLDFLKAYFYLLALDRYGFSALYLASAAIALLVGNGFPVFLGFRGGKGVATSLGVLGMLQPFLLFCALIIWCTIFVISKTVGLASVVTLVLLPMCSVFLVHDLTWMGFFAVFVSLWGLFLHRNNIKSFYCTVSK